MTKLRTTINLHETDIDIDLNLVPNKAQSLNCEYAIVFFGFGGTNGSIILRGLNNEKNK